MSVRRVQVGRVGVVVPMALWVVMGALCMAGVVVGMVWVSVGWALHVLVRVRVQVMVTGLILPRWHHLHHMTHGVHAAIRHAPWMVGKGSFQSQLCL